MAFKFAGSPESAEQLRNMLDAQLRTREKLQDTGQSFGVAALGFREGVPVKSTSGEPGGSRGEFWDAARNPEAAGYFGDWLMRMSNFERNINPEPPSDQGVA